MIGEQPHRATLGLGSNLGDRMDNLQGAVDALGETPGVVVDGVSPVYETAPFGGKDQPDYLNAVVTLRTKLPPRLLLERARGSYPSRVLTEAQSRLDLEETRLRTRSR